MAAFASAPSSYCCLSPEAASDAKASRRRGPFFLHRLYTHSRQTRQSPKKCISFCLARNVPPEQGRGKNARKASYQGLQRAMKGKDADMEGWTEVATAADFLEGKNKAIIHNKKGYVLVKRDEELRAIEANCTSCKFPIMEGKVSQQEDGALEISCPLCHTRFSLDDGRVLQYCPKDGLVQWFIGTIKDKATPVAAKILPARTSKSGRVYVRFLNVRVI
ncbi:hypothetical protein GOP47_0028452 [Adiantum capillus-veneris]|nr:hypothetical protein GOP47_0028452 [Adiantum capillus-veneris]